MASVYNCIICAKEFDESELKSVVLSTINTARFKICEDCLKSSDPIDDYQQAKDIVNSYLKYSELKKQIKTKETK